VSRRVAKLGANDDSAADRVETLRQPGVRFRPRCNVRSIRRTSPRDRARTQQAHPIRGEVLPENRRRADPRATESRILMWWRRVTRSDGMHAGARVPAQGASFRRSLQAVRRLELPGPIAGQCWILLHAVWWKAGIDTATCPLVEGDGFFQAFSTPKFGLI